MFLCIISVEISALGGFHGDDQWRQDGTPANQIGQIEYQVKLPSMKEAETRVGTLASLKSSIDELDRAFKAQDKNRDRRSPFNAQLMWNLLSDKRAANDKNTKRQAPVYYFEGNPLAFNPFTENGYLDEHDVVHAPTEEASAVVSAS